MTGGLPLPPEVVEILEQDPYVEKTVDQVLHDLGLPPLPHLRGHDGQQAPDSAPAQQPSPIQLPQFSLPTASAPGSASQTSAPTMPSISNADITGLIQPLVSLLGLLGSGSGSGNSGSDSGGGNSGSGSSGSSPSSLLSGVASGLEQALQMGGSALSAASAVWQGLGAVSVHTKNAQATQNNQQLQSQNQTLQQIVDQAGATVSSAVQQINGVIATTTANIVAQMAGLPLSWPMMVATAQAGLAQGMQIITTTEGQLSAQAGQITQAGTTISVTPDAGSLSGLASSVGSLASGLGSLAGGLGGSSGAGTGADGSSSSTGDSSGGGSGSGMGSMLQQIAQPVEQIAQPVEQIAQQAVNAVTGGGAANAVQGLNNAAASVAAGLGLGGAGVAGGGGVGIGGVGGAAAPPDPLTPAVSAKVAGAESASMEDSAVVEQPTTAEAETGSGMMPVGAGAGAAMAAGAKNSESSHKSNVVSAAYGDEVVGETEPSSFPVVGEIDDVDIPFDKEQAFKIF